MNERPILFSGPMVRAILADLKTQTRRVVKAPRSVAWDGRLSPPIDQCPYGTAGSKLWVRETWADTMGDPPTAVYRADGERHPASHLKWTPSIHMPRWASRLTLEIVNVRVERLQEISEADAKAEGDKNPFDGHLHNDGTPIESSAVLRFKCLWDSINAKRAPWASNPWVWVVEFRKAIK